MIGHADPPCRTSTAPQKSLGEARRCVAIRKRNPPSLTCRSDVPRAAVGHPPTCQTGAGADLCGTVSCGGQEGGCALIAGHLVWARFVPARSDCRVEGAALAWPKFIQPNFKTAFRSPGGGPDRHFLDKVKGAPWFAAALAKPALRQPVVSVNLGFPSFTVLRVKKLTGR